MFIENTLKANKKLIETAITLHQTGKILPDSYVIDVDQLMQNAKIMLKTAQENKIRLFFMLKQLGRNPYLAKKLVELGYPGAVVVDYNEAKMMMKHQIPIVHVGHLVQPPFALIDELVHYGIEYFTVYSLEKIKDIHFCAQKRGKVQKIILRVVGDGDMMYSGQTAGFMLNQLVDLVEQVKTLEYIQISGVTAFPCFLYDNEKIEPTSNLKTVLAAKGILENCGINCDEINIPSSTCCYTLPAIAQAGGTSGEPGHGLSGTTPLHAHCDQPEKPCVVYVSEISHTFQKESYCYGGGFYRRGHMTHALIGKSIDTLKKTQVITPNHDSIDYHFGLAGLFDVNLTVVMAFRFQIFVTRSTVVLLEGLQSEKPSIQSYTALGELL